MSNFGDVELAVEKQTGSTTIASQTYTPDINIGNAASNSFSSPAQQAFEFDIAEQGDYVIAIYSAASEWSDCIVGQLILSANNYVSTGISPMYNGQWIMDNEFYSLQGRKVTNPQKGIYIKNSTKVVIK